MKNEEKYSVRTIYHLAHTNVELVDTFDDIESRDKFYDTIREKLYSIIRTGGGCRKNSDTTSTIINMSFVEYIDVIKE